MPQQRLRLAALVNTDRPLRMGNRLELSARRQGGIDFALMAMSQTRRFIGGFGEERGPAIGGETDSLGNPRQPDRKRRGKRVGKYVGGIKAFVTETARQIPEPAQPPVSLTTVIGQDSVHGGMAIKRMNHPGNAEERYLGIPETIAQYDQPRCGHHQVTEPVWNADEYFHEGIGADLRSVSGPPCPSIQNQA